MRTAAKTRTGLSGWAPLRGAPISKCDRHLTLKPRPDEECGDAAATPRVRSRQRWCRSCLYQYGRRRRGERSGHRSHFTKKPR